MRVETETNIGLRVLADISKHYPATRYSPEEPASIEDLRLFIGAVEITGDVYDEIYKVYGEEIEADVQEQVNIEHEEEAMSYAEHLDDIRRMR